MQHAFAVVNVTISPTVAEVYIEHRLLLRCKYTGVREHALLELNWEYRALGQTLGTKIWTYDGSKNIDTSYGMANEQKFEKIGTDITKEHAIRLKEAALADEGTYSCRVEYFNGGGDYAERNAHTRITVIGRRMSCDYAE